MSFSPSARETRLAEAQRVWRIEYDRHGGPEVLVRRYCHLSPPGPGEVRIAVRAASVNPVDGKIRGGVFPSFPCVFPSGTGRDGAGVVVALGDGVDPAWLRRRVAFLAPRASSGSWAEAVNMPVGVLGTIPDALDDAAAAALPLAGQSAEAVLNAGGIACRNANKGKRVLILAASGGVGRIAVQLARLAGAQVHATASSGHRTGLERLGCSKVWAYDKGEDYASTDRFDLVVDLLGGAEHERSYRALRKGGTLACLNAKPIVDRSAEFGVRVVVADVIADGARLGALLSLVKEGKLDPGPKRVLPASSFAEAQLLCDGGHAGGKIVLNFGAE